MIEITINPAGETPERLRAAARFLEALAGGEDEQTAAAVRVVNAATIVPPAPGAVVVPPPPIALAVAGATAPAVPSVPGATVSGTGAAPLDSEGLPWDHRIHSETRACNKDGTWRVKRNSDPAFVEGIKAELRGVMAAPAATPVPTVAGVPQEVASAGFGADDAAGAGALDFPAFMEKVTARMVRGEVSFIEIEAAAQRAGLPSLQGLAQRPDLIAAVAADLGVS